jgi:hypothetical protein
MMDVILATMNELLLIAFLERITTGLFLVTVKSSVKGKGTNTISPCLYILWFNNCPNGHFQEHSNHFLDN